jgi:hypothetical protein
MKITSRQLRNIIKEEIAQVLINEGSISPESQQLLTLFNQLIKDKDQTQAFQILSAAQGEMKIAAEKRPKAAGTAGGSWSPEEMAALRASAGIK